MTARKHPVGRRRMTLRTTHLGDNQYHHECPKCGWNTTTDGDEQITHVCGQPEKTRRLGDQIQSALESIGITKDSYRAVKAELGLPSTCNCDARQEWINRLDEKLGLAEKVNAFKAFMGW